MGKGASLSTVLNKLNQTVGLVLFVYCLLYYVSVFHVVSSCLTRGLSQCNFPHQVTTSLNITQIVPWLSVSVPGVVNLIVLSSTWSISLYCYLFTVYTDPGR
jgi:hypothetical protein